MDDLLNLSEDEYLLAVASSYTTMVNEELNSDLELLRAIDIDALIEQHALDRPVESAEAEDDTGFVTENTVELVSEEEIDVDEIIDILNVSNEIIVISDSGE